MSGGDNDSTVAVVAVALVVLIAAAAAAAAAADDDDDDDTCTTVSIAAPAPVVLVVSLISHQSYRQYSSYVPYCNQLECCCHHCYAVSQIFDWMNPFWPTSPFNDLKSFTEIPNVICYIGFPRHCRIVGAFLLAITWNLLFCCRNYMYESKIIIVNSSIPLEC